MIGSFLFNGIFVFMNRVVGLGKDFLMQENGSLLLQENGDRIILE